MALRQSENTIVGLTTGRQPRRGRALAAIWLAAGLLLSAFGLLAAKPARAHDAHSGHLPGFGLLLFPAITVESLSGSGKARETSSEPGASIFFSRDFGPLRVLLEALWTNTEREIERAMVGWKFSPLQTLWLGRVHSPIGYWNTEHHHGPYLQTTISRPRIVDFEDDGGLLPLHWMGLQHSGLTPRGEGAFVYDVGVGSGPVFANALEPVAVLRPQTYGKLGLVGRLGWRPDVTAATEFGGSFATLRIPIEGTSGELIRQSIGNAYLHWDQAQWRVRLEAFLIRNEFEGRLAGTAGSIKAGFVQGEYRHDEHWIGFARAEALTAASNDPYIGLFGDASRSRQVLGLRLDLPYRQALKLELGREHRQSGDRLRQASVQWSTVLP